MSNLIAVDLPSATWAMAPVPADQWDWFTKLPNTGAVQMWTRDDLLDDAGGFGKWEELIGPNGTGEGYAVALRCDCGAYRAYEVTWGVAYDPEFTDDGSVMMQLDGLDALMRPFVDEHNPHRWQLRMPL